MSWLELKYDVGWGDYQCLLACALDEDEMEDYSFVALTHGGDSVKNWKWSSPDKAGQMPLFYSETFTPQTEDTPFHKMKQFAENMNFMQTGERKLQPTGSALEFSKATGRPIGFVNPDQTIVDENRNPIERTPNMILVKSDLWQ